MKIEIFVRATPEMPFEDAYHLPYNLLARIEDYVKEHLAQEKIKHIFIEYTKSPWDMNVTFIPLNGKPFNMLGLV